MATILTRKTKSGRVRHTALIRIKGLPAISHTLASKTAIRKWAAQVEADIHSRRLLPRLESERHTLNEAIERYLEEELLSPGSRNQANTRGQLRFWADALGSASLANVTPAAITEARSGLLRRVSGPTSNRYLAAVSQVLSFCEKEWEWLDQNPCKKVRRKPENRGRVRFLSEDERPALLEACEASSEPRLYPLVLCALASGARQSELLGLAWKDVDLANRRAVLHKTKNRDRRMLSFEGKAGDLVREMARTPNISGYVFASRLGKPTFPRTAWVKAVEEAKLDDFVFHDLRHTAASYLAMSEATLPEIAAFLGHRTLAMVKRYAHLTEQHSAAVASRMAAKYLP